MEYFERKISVFKPNYIEPLYVVQGSNMINIKITFADWDIPTGATVKWQVITSTKGELNNATYEDNTVSIVPYNTTFSEAGKGYLQLRVEKDEKVLVSFAIDVYIFRDRLISPVEGSNSDVVKVLVDQYVEEATDGLIEQIEAEVQRVIETIPSDYTALESRVDELENGQGGGLTEQAKQALLACFAKVAWIDANGQTYYDALENALYAITEISVSPTSLSFGTLGDTQQLTGRTTPSGGTITWSSSNTSVATVDSTGLVTSVGYGTATITASCQGYTATCAVTIAQATVTSISAVYTQSGTVYDTDSLETLKSDLVVTAHWSNGTTSTVTDYELSGTLAEGTSTITVSYGGKTTTFNVTVVHNQIVYSLYNQTFSKSTEGVDTGIKLLETDRTFTILFDGIQTANASANRLFKCVGTESPRKGVYVGSTASAGNSNTAVQWFTNEQHMAFGRSDSGRIRIMYFHEKDSNSVTFKWKKDAESVNTLTLTDTFVAHTGNLLIGESGNNNWVGTLTKFELYDTAIDSTAENSFFGDE